MAPLRAYACKHILQLEILLMMVGVFEIKCIELKYFLGSLCLTVKKILGVKVSRIHSFLLIPLIFSMVACKEPQSTPLNLNLGKEIADIDLSQYVMIDDDNHITKEPKKMDERIYSHKYMEKEIYESTNYNNQNDLIHKVWGDTKTTSFLTIDRKIVMSIVLTSSEHLPTVKKELAKHFGKPVATDEKILNKELFESSEFYCGVNDAGKDCPRTQFEVYSDGSDSYLICWDESVGLGMVLPPETIMLTGRKKLSEDMLKE